MLERSRRCLAMLLLIVTWKKTGGRAEPDDPRMVLGETYTPASRCTGGISAKAGLNTVPVFSQLPSFWRRKKKKTPNTHPAFCWVATVFFPPSQNGSRAVGSLAVQERSGSAEGRGEKPLALPRSLRSTEAGSPRSCYGSKSSFAPVNGEQPCGLKSEGGCHRNARLSP